ncbi:MAG: T9SS type A sorting domain-containing protein [Bacteroidales bacterium]|jgi:hypothetical protein|nr:T9SS type A sorting domain-containing protein [Bacteroidales bacterium]
MKTVARLLFVLYFSFCILHFASAQWGGACLPEGIAFQEQSAVDSFQVNYPGCTEIEGDVLINGYIFNLNGLMGLEAIGGDLDITTVMFPDLTGLDSLKTIGGNLTFYATELTNMTGLSSLESVGGDLSIGCFTHTGWYCSNPYLENLAGLHNLNSIGGALTLQSCDSLTDIDALTGLTDVSTIYIKANPLLGSISGLANINPDMLESLTIAGNPSLNACDIESLCSYLDDPSGEINIYDNGTGCDSPAEIADACGVTLDCLPYGNYWLLTQEDVNSFPQDFPDCNDIEGYIYIIGPDITSLEPLSQVYSINGSLILGHEWLGGGNPILENLEGLENIDSISGGLRIQYNPMLQDLAGFQNLKYVGGYLQLIANDLTSLSGLEDLAAIGYGIEISGEDRLKDLSGLENLTEAGSSLLIRLNDSLVSLEGIDNISAGSISLLNIYFNDMLSECDVASICEYLAAPNGEIEISGNASGCNSVEEVMAECTVGIDEQAVGSRRSAVRCYPNPTAGTSEFLISNFDSQQVSLKLYDVNGRQVAILLDGMCNGDKVIRWDMSALPVGIYFYQFSTEGIGQGGNGKIVKY